MASPPAGSDTVTADARGYLCQASCADNKEDFVFLVSLDVAEKTLKYVLANRKAAMCKFVLIAAHRRNPHGHTDPDQPNPTVDGLLRSPTARFKLTSNDIDYVRVLASGATVLSGKEWCNEPAPPRQGVGFLISENTNRSDDRAQNKIRVDR
jgi:hypothetical protein